MVDEQLGYEHDYWAYAGIANGIDFYIFLFMKNWALSIFVICSAFLSYEIAKFVTRRYKPKLKRKRETTAEYMQNLP